MSESDNERRAALFEALRRGCKVIDSGTSRTSASKPVRMRLSDLQWLLLDAHPLLAVGHVWAYEWDKVLPGVYDVRPVLSDRAPSAEDDNHAKRP